MRALLAIVVLLALSGGATAQPANAWLRAQDQAAIEAFRDGGTLIVFAHQDDDLLWMLPFWPDAKRFVLAAYPPSPVFQRLVQKLPPELNYRARWTPAWDPIDDDSFATTFTDRCARAPVVNLQSVVDHLRRSFTPDIRRVVTHNNWGEYGHVQHRLVNAAVRRLAVERGIDVYALGVRVDETTAAGPSGYTDVARQTGLPAIEGYFDAELFRQVRAAYLDTAPAASTDALTARFRQWSPTLWTWSAARDAFPQGWRPFIKLVDRGTDLTLGNATVAALEKEVPVSGECEARPVLPKQ